MSDAVKFVSATEAFEMLKNNQSIKLIDVREPHEYEFCNIKGALLCSLSRFDEAISEANLSKSDKIVLYCHHGVRSMKAAIYLADQGFEDLYSLEGGIEAWSLEVDPSVARY